MTLGHFLDQDPDAVAPPTAPKVWIIPAGLGASPDPASAVIEASPQVELFDEEVWDVPKRWFQPMVTDPAPSLEALERMVRDAVQAGALPLVIGADESVFRSLARGCVTPGERAHLLHLGARPCLGARGSDQPIQQIMADGVSVTAAGLRAIDKDEAECVQTPSAGYAVFRASGRAAADALSITKRIAGEPVVIALDVGVFDGALMPATTAPEPGGLSWEEVLNILRSCVDASTLLGVVITGLRPHPALHAADFLTAKLAYKILTFAFCPKNSAI